MLRVATSGRPCSSRRDCTWRNATQRAHLLLHRLEPDERVELGLELRERSRRRGGGGRNGQVELARDLADTLAHGFEDVVDHALVVPEA